MILEIKVPSPGESITEVEIGSWLVEDGAVVAKDQEIAEVESDKATLTIVAQEGGKIEIKAAEGESVAVGSVVCTIDTSVAPAPSKEKKTDKEEPQTEKKVEAATPEKELKTSAEFENVKVTTLAKEMMKELDLSVDDVINGLKRIGKKEIEAVANLPKSGLTQTLPELKKASREIERER
ncbi:MAG TPA: biotin/lipoyl-containing protein, partial [Draconibacterium sp.]|nr:biotin/lipoyl-containing protein [Draconibacterium sp.]